MDITEWNLTYLMEGDFGNRKTGLRQYCVLLCMSVRKKKDANRGNGALYDATHGQFGEEPRPEPLPPYEKETEDSDNNAKDRVKAARKKSKSV